MHGQSCHHRYQQQCHSSFMIDTVRLQSCHKSIACSECNEDKARCRDSNMNRCIPSVRFRIASKPISHPHDKRQNHILPYTIGALDMQLYGKIPDKKYQKGNNHPPNLHILLIFNNLHITTRVNTMIIDVNKRTGQNHIAPIRGSLLVNRIVRLNNSFPISRSV